MSDGSAGARHGRGLAGQDGVHAASGIHHLNSAGASIPTRAVLDAVVDHLTLETSVGGYAAAADRGPQLEAVYASVARMIGARPEEIALTESATVAWQRLFDAMRLPAGSRVLAARSTYVSMALNLLEWERTRGIIVEILPSDETGGVDLDALELALRTPAAFVTASHVPTSSGLIEPVAAIGELARAAGVPFILDATQSVGHLPIDVTAFRADALFATGRKFLRGPRGTGFLYVSNSFADSLQTLAPDVRGAEWTSDRGYEVGSSALRFETWETSHALRLGLGVAIDQLAATGIDTISSYIGGLGSLMRERLAALPGVTITDPSAATGSGIVTFVVDGEDPRDTSRKLTAAGIHTLAVPATHGQWDLGNRGLTRVVRASVHVYNGEADIDAVERVIGSAVRSAVAPKPSVRTADVVVVGTGIYGRSVARSLAKRGRTVIQLEQFGPDHVEGSSHGSTRMIRRAYPNEIWDPLVEGAYAAWDQLSLEAGEPLVTATGGLFSRPASMEGVMRGPGCVTVSQAEASSLFPALHIPDDYSILYDAKAGIIEAERAMTALTKLAAADGVSTLYDERVISWTESVNGVTVETTSGTISAGMLVVCAGGWTSRLVPELADALVVHRIVNAHFGASDPALVAQGNLGVFSVETGDHGLLYGFPAHNGRGVKVGLDDGPVDDLDAPRRDVSAEEAELLRMLVSRYVPAADGAVEASISCRYTMAPRSRFAVGPVPGADRVIVASACSGHGFKFGPVLGEALADFADGIPRPDLAFLSLDAMLSAQA